MACAPGPSTIVVHIQLRTSYSGWHMALSPWALCYPTKPANISSSLPKGWLATWVVAHPTLLCTGGTFVQSKFNRLAGSSTSHIFPQFLTFTHSSCSFTVDQLTGSAGTLGTGMPCHWLACGLVMPLFSILNFFLTHVIGTSSVRGSLQAKEWAAQGWYCHLLGSFGYSRIPIHLVLIAYNIAQCYVSSNATHTLLK